MLGGARQSILRVRQGHEHARVTNVELFFDLVFVFAVTQLSHTLLEHVTPLGIVEVLLLFMAVWWAWINTSWVTNWLDPERVSVRLLLFALMLGGLVLSTSIPKAFETRGLAFAAGFAAIQVTRDLFMLWALRRHNADNFRNFQRIFCWHTLAVTFWIAGGFADTQTRLGLWLVALAIDTAAPSLYFWVPGLGRSSIADWDVEGGHLAERCGLFVIIALGESVLVTGAVFGNLDWNAVTIAAFAQAFLGSVAMWWIYFNIGAERAAETISNAGDPGRLARLAYTYMHLPIIAGIIVCAVADELVLAHPAGHADTTILITGVGGPTLYLLGNLLFKRTICGWIPLSHLVGLGLMAILASAASVTTWLTPLALCSGATTIMIIVAIWETRSLRPAGKQRP